MFRKQTILVLVFVLLTTFLAPARLVLACPLQTQSSLCPMRAARRKAQGPSCCATRATPPTATISAPCCCKLQPAPTPPSFPEATTTTSSLVFVLSTARNPLAAPLTRTCLVPAVAQATSPPRGSPLPFAALRAPPLFS